MHLSLMELWEARYSEHNKTLQIPQQKEGGKKSMFGVDPKATALADEVSEPYQQMSDFLSHLFSPSDLTGQRYLLVTALWDTLSASQNIHLGSEQNTVES